MRPLPPKVSAEPGSSVRVPPAVVMVMLVVVPSSSSAAAVVGVKEVGLVKVSPEAHPPPHTVAGGDEASLAASPHVLGLLWRHLLWNKLKHKTII